MKTVQNRNNSSNYMTIESVRNLIIFSITLYELIRCFIVPNPIINTTSIKDKPDIPIISPIKFADESMARNIEFIDVRLLCKEFINKTGNGDNSDNTNVQIDKIKTILAKTEYLLVGIIDLIDIKLKMDKHIINRIENNKCKSLNLDKPDRDARMTLEKAFNETMNKIDSYMQQLRIQCNFQLHQKIETIIRKTVIIKKPANYKPLATNNIGSKLTTLTQDIEWLSKNDYLMPDENDELPQDL